MKKGFTLIELLAVIVILAIIALIATPIILGIINDAREESNERSVELYASAVRNGIASYQLREGKEVLPGTYNESNPLPFEPEYDGKVDCTNVIISENGKVSLEKCTVNGGTKEYSYGIEEETGKACTLEDKDSNGVASLSDVITCGTESFYVMSNENEEITMLSMYNLYVGDVITVDTEYNPLSQTPLENPTGKQDPLAKGAVLNDTTWYGTVVFSSTNYWSTSVSSYPACVYNENSNLYQYVSEYERILKEDLKVNSASATLISYEQLKSLGCDDTKHTCGPDTGEGALEKSAPEWVYSTSYWTGSAYNPSAVWFVLSRGTFIYGINDFGDYSGVRPVITISTREIE